MELVSIPEAKELIKHVAIRKHRPLGIWGPSGIGKSDAVLQAAKEADGTLVDIRVSQYASVDFRGIPDISGGMTVWNMPATLPFKGNRKFVEDRRPIVMFLDEINQGQPSVMSVCYQLLNDRRIGEHMLMDNVAIVVAGNRDQDKGVTNRYPAPLANRGSHCEIAPSISAWTGWAIEHKVPNELIGFLNFRDALLHNFDPARATEKSFATPRSWAFTADDLSDPDMPDNLRWQAISGNVGKGPAAELQAFIGLMDNLPSLRQVLADPEGVPIENNKTDMQWALATFISGHMADDENLPKLQRFLERLDPEMVVVSWQMAIKRNEDLLDTKTFLHGYAPKYRAVFRA